MKLREEAATTIVQVSVLQGIGAPLLWCGHVAYRHTRTSAQGGRVPVSATWPCRHGMPASTPC